MYSTVSRTELKTELIAEIMSDPSNRLFGIPLSQVQRMIFDYKEKGVDPYEMVRVHQELVETKQRLTEVYEVIHRSGWMIMKLGQPWNPSSSSEPTAS